jgi:DNA invertase Pin-like site-specific DNA recombinase
MCGVFGEFERAMIVERIKAELSRAKAQGKVLGRPKTATSIEDQVRTLKASGFGILKVAMQLGIGTSVVQRIVNETAAS